MRTAPGDTGGAVADPHIWTSPANAIIMAGNIAKALRVIHLPNAPTYDANAAAYVVKLQQLDDWVRSQIATIPADNRKMVVSHDSLGYYADLLWPHSDRHGDPRFQQHRGHPPHSRSPASRTPSGGTM